MIRMCVVSDTTLKKMVFREEEFEKAKEMFRKGRWNSLQGRILIHPFVSKSMGAFSYDLCVGDEIFNLNTQQVISMTNKGGAKIKANDVALVLTREYLGLPRDVIASVVPRFSFVRKGVFQSMTKIDPTWFGKIAVAIVNHSSGPFTLLKGQPFSSLVIQKLDVPCSKIRALKDTRSLGAESINCFLNDTELLKRKCLR